MSAVGIKKPAAVGTPLLDEFLGCQWSLSDELVGHELSFLRSGPIRIDNNAAGGILLVYFNRLRVDQLRGVVGPEVLYCSLRNQHKRADYAERQQNPE